MSEHSDHSSAEFSVAEYHLVKSAAIARGLTIEGFKRHCVRRILFAPPQPTPPDKPATGLRAVLQSVASFKFRKPK